ncbi:MAG: hypothetical protein LBN18_02975, partial [Dysgonamonadaceae bacterium]|nr:hypothetical protein [Dysgonamonadaceae bacterium]
NSFEMKELNTFNFYGQCPNPYLDAGWLISHYGYADYRIVQVQGGFAKKIFSELSAGINLRYFYENSFLAEKVNYAWNADVGLCYQPNETFVFSLLAEQILHTFPEDRWKIHAGLGYQATGQCWLAAEIFYDAEHQFNLSLGIEYEIIESLQVQLGIQTSTQMPSLGVAYRLNKWDIATGFAMHPTLGISSMVSMSYQF